MGREAQNTVDLLEKKLLAAYKQKQEAEDAIRNLTLGLQGVELGKQVANEIHTANEAAERVPDPDAE
jgi:hypothetical protein